jgi:hypothetical protein
VTFEEAFHWWAGELSIYKQTTNDRAITNSIGRYKKNKFIESARRWLCSWTNFLLLASYENELSRLQFIEITFLIFASGARTRGRRRSSSLEIFVFNQILLGRTKSFFYGTRGLDTCWRSADENDSVGQLSNADNHQNFGCPWEFSAQLSSGVGRISHVTTSWNLAAAAAAAVKRPVAEGVFIAISHIWHLLYCSGAPIFLAPAPPHWHPKNLFAASPCAASPGRRKVEKITQL